MLTGVMERDESIVVESGLVPGYEDPLDDDEAVDETLTTTRRKLIRLALVASETASRFVREGVTIDPMAWMLAPRRLFEGRTALDACLDRDECLRAVLLHGLSVGMDAAPIEIDELVADDVDDADALERRTDRHGMVGHTPSAEAMPAQDCGGRRLWTSCIVSSSENCSMHVFDALIASDRTEVEDRLRARHRLTGLEDLDIVDGFDASRLSGQWLLSSAMKEMLEQLARDPSSSLLGELWISVQARFPE